VCDLLAARIGGILLLGVIEGFAEDVLRVLGQVAPDRNWQVVIM
jgi:hypothetical protein